MSGTDLRIIVRSFVDELTEALGSKKTLAINVVQGESPILPSAVETISGTDWIDVDQTTEHFDFVLADLPLGLNRERVQVGDDELNIRRNWGMLFEALRYLAEDGLCLALVEPSGFSVAEGPKFEEALNEEGFFVRGLFNTPSETLSAASVRPVLVGIDRHERTSVFAGEIDEVSYAQQLARRFAENDPGNSLRQGVQIEPRAFKGFDSLRADQQLARLETQYKEYDSVRLGDLARDVRTVRSGEQHVDAGNAVYIPMIGTSATTHDLEQVTVKHHNVFQVVLSRAAESEYVAAFFRSDLGRLVLRSLTMGAFIPKIRKSSIYDAQIALPGLSEQRGIVATHRQLSSLSDAIADFQSELALNPKSAIAIKDQVDSMLEQIGGLTDVDRMMSLIRSGESKSVEFKESFSLDVRKGSKEKYIELAALKTVVAFLNTDGGTLLVGVTDDGDVVGVEQEVKKFYKSLDSYLLHVKNQIKQRIGEDFYPFIDHRIASINGSDVLIFECGQSTRPCYLDGKDFYVRTNPATDKLEGPKLVEYVRIHFDS